MTSGELLTRLRRFLLTLVFATFDQYFFFRNICKTLPKKPDIIWYKNEDIIGKIYPPLPVNKDRIKSPKWRNICLKNTKYQNYDKSVKEIHKYVHAMSRHILRRYLIFLISHMYLFIIFCLIILSRYKLVYKWFDSTYLTIETVWFKYVSN